MFKRFLVALAVMLGGVGGSFAVTGPAAAAAADCPSNYFCIWTGYNFTGSRYSYYYGDLIDAPNNGTQLGSGINNKGRSFYNHFAVNLKVNIVDGNACGTSTWYRTMVRGQSATAQGSDWGDRVSSIQLTNAAPLSC